ncbi:MAG: hypothetical protein QOI70_1394 [Microbacteriaceae bacterium]|jgi:hypothetical protein|nr:hypothetical protein [Microbacteriaceae bacterium]
MNTTAAAFTTARETKLVARITSDQLIGALDAPVGSAEFLGVLAPSGLGSPAHFVGTRVDGQAHEDVVLVYGSGSRAVTRTWAKSLESTNEVVYALVSDTSTSGYVSR